MLAIELKLQNKSPISLFLFSLMLLSKALPGNPYLDEVRQHQANIIREEGKPDSEDLRAPARATRDQVQPTSFTMRKRTPKEVKIWPKVTQLGSSQAKV